MAVVTELREDGLDVVVEVDDIGERSSQSLLSKNDGDPAFHVRFRFT